jgi:hypothetical protein
MLCEEGRISLETEAIISTREKILHSRVINEYLIKWKNLMEEDVSWELENFHQLHPSLSLL